MKFIAIIPARYASTRFPGKPLVDINGKPMIQRVYEQVQKTKLFHTICVATDDERIKTAVEKFKGKVVMTSPDHKSGTDRCKEAVIHILKYFPVLDSDVVINIQGDEPYISPTQIKMLTDCFYDYNVNIATIIKKINNYDELHNPNVVKVVCDQLKKALYFSRSVMPYYRDLPIEEWHLKHDYFKHVGIYGYKIETLLQITNLKQSTLEKIESLEQLRWLENGYEINVNITDEESYAIDTPEDLQKILEKFKD